MRVLHNALRYRDMSQSCHFAAWLSIVQAQASTQSLLLSLVDLYQISQRSMSKHEKYTMISKVGNPSNKVYVEL
jgi:hypothetical protein